MCADQGYNEVGWRAGQEESMAPLCSNLRSFRSKCTVLKKVLVTLLGLFRVPWRPHSDSASWEFTPHLPPRYTPGADAVVHKLVMFFLSNNTIKLRIQELSIDILKQTIAAAKQSENLNSELGETTDLGNDAQFIVVMRYRATEDDVERPLLTSTSHKYNRKGNV